MGLTLNRGREAADGPWSSSQEAACRPARPEFHYGHARAAAVSMRQRAADASPALKFVLMVGVMSFFADFTYEGARSITGPYLGLLGAGAFAISVISGTGEFLGYNIRLLSGRGADRTGRYWPVTIGGYILQMSVVPLLALAGNWQVAALLIIAERIGKGIRNPPRDAMLSHAAKDIGYGRAFVGVQESLIAGVAGGRAAGVRRLRGGHQSRPLAPGSGRDPHPGLGRRGGLVLVRREFRGLRRKQDGPAWRWGGSPAPHHPPQAHPLNGAEAVMDGRPRFLRCPVPGGQESPVRQARKYTSIS